MDTRLLVRTIAVVLGDEDTLLLVAGAALEPGDEAWLPPLDGGGVDWAGVPELGVSGVGSGVGVGAGVDAGGAEVCCRDDAGGAGVGVLPVPLACRFSPWWR